jgi:Sulfotransferase family
MIVSHEHKWIFLATLKTASTSTEMALSRLCGPGDIIAPISVEGLKRSELPALNHKLGLGRWGIHVPGELRHRFPRLHGFYRHMPASQVRHLVGDQVWRSYFKFATERNPWDRQVSYYLWKTKSRKERPDFESFITASWWERGFHRAYQSNWPIYTINGKVAVDRILRFENIERELGEVCRQLGTEQDMQLPRAKIGPDRLGYRHFYNDRTREIVAQWFRREIAAFGYEF